MGGSGRLLGRLKKLERAFSIDTLDIFDVVMWAGDRGGLFGHAHYRMSKSETVVSPCSAEEEIEIMRRYYEDDGHSLFGRTDVSFAEYLEGYCYLGPEGLAVERALVIQKLRGEAIGA